MKHAFVLFMISVLCACAAPPDLSDWKKGKKDWDGGGYNAPQLDVPKQEQPQQQEKDKSGSNRGGWG